VSQVLRVSLFYVQLLALIVAICFSVLGFSMLRIDSEAVTGAFAFVTTLFIGLSVWTSLTALRPHNKDLQPASSEV
jgi:ABC-type uncharacterized transport system permease subunit